MAGGRIDILVAPSFDGFDSNFRSGMSRAGSLASVLGKGLGVAIAGGTAIAAVGLKNVIDLGIEYQGNLNELQAVTGATGIEMAKVGQIAKELGSDMSLPGTSAADAAAAMKELAKGGLSVADAMTAAKGTLQLAAAAQIDAAQAAEIQSDALNQFGLAADQAGHVADVLANTANAASGEITDMANALKYVGPVARGLGVDIDNTAAAIGLLAVNGIRGEQAGTSLRGILASLASPSVAAAAAMKTLGIVAFDQTGKFVGLRTVTEQLSAAKGKLTDAEFAAAASTAFGNEGFTAANALALSGAPAFDAMAESVSKAGGAAEVSAAKTKGLGGAWDGLKSQLETTGIEIFEAIDGPLEKLVRSGAENIDQFGKVVVDGLNTAVAAGEVYGPRLAAAISSRASVVGDAVKDVFGPIVTNLGGPLNEALNTAIELWDDFTGVIKNAVEGAKPVANGIAAIATAAADGDGPVSALGTGIGIIGDVARIASALLIPLGAVVGGIATAFAALPGPVQTAVVAFGLLAAFRGPLVALGTTVASSLITPFRNFGETMRIQQALVTGSSQIMSSSIGKVGLAMGALQARVPVIGKMADSFRTASTAAQGFVVGQSALIQTASGISGSYTGAASALGKTEGALRSLAGATAGTVAAIGTGLKSAASGLAGAFGGPAGLAVAGIITAVGVGLSLLASRQRAAAQAAQEHEQQIGNFASALRDSNGVINDNVRATTAKSIQDTKIADSQKSVADSAREMGISLTDVTRAVIDGGQPLEALKTKLQGVIEANKEFATDDTGELAWTGRYNETGVAAQGLLASITGMAGGFDDAKKRNDELNRAIKEGRASYVDATDSGRTLAAAMATLSSNTASADDRARALNDALIALSGGSINLEAAQFRVADVMDRLGQIFAVNGDEAAKAAAQTKGYGAALLNADGSLSSATENGRNLRSTLQDLTRDSADVAQKTYDMAIAQGEGIPAATAKAVAAVQVSRDSFIGLAKDMGISSEQAAVLADRAGLIPKNVAIAVSTPGDDKTKQELAIIKGLVDAVPPGKDIHMQTISADAEKKLEELGFKVTHMEDGTVTIQGNTGPAQAALNSFLSAPATKTVYIVYSDPGYAGSTQRLAIGNGPGIAAGAVLSKAFANGGLATAFAQGGLARVTPLKGGVAQVVPPNTWRIVGDRMVDDEAYIPINQSNRSRQILDETAHRMGYALARRYATGGIAMSGAGNPGGGFGGGDVHFNIDARGATVGAVRALEQSTIPKLRMMLATQVGKKGR